MKLRKRLHFLGLLLLVSLVLAACGDNTATTNSAPAAAPTTAAMAMTTAAPTTAAMAVTTSAAPTMAAMTPSASMGAMTTSAASTTAAMTSGAAGASAGKVIQLTIADFKFTPDNITIPAGTKVVWTNNDSVSHTVTGDDTSGPLKSDLIPQGKTFEFTFDKAGTYAYHCTPHPFMKGTITVTP